MAGRRTLTFTLNGAQQALSIPRQNAVGEEVRAPYVAISSSAQRPRLAGSVKWLHNYTVRSSRPRT